jgi:hypothetical protein
MESSRHYLLQAEVEYWHDMLRLNRHRLPESRQKEMRDCLRRALRALNHPGDTHSYRAAA